MPVIIIEGADNVGKTSVAKYIANKLGYKYIHFGPPSDPETVKYEYLDFIETVDNAVVDRSFIGEFVYGPLFRNYEPDYFDELEQAVIDSGKRFLYLLFYADNETIKQYDLNKDNAKLLQYNTEVNHRFINVFNKIKSGEKFIFNMGHFKSLAEKQQTIFEFVYKWIKKENPIPAFTNDYRYTLFDPKFRFVHGNMEIPTCGKCSLFLEHSQYDYYKAYHQITWGAGSLKPKILFVGEAPGWKGCGRTGIPFYNDASGTLFRNALFWLRILETEIYITNVVKCTPLNNKLNGRGVHKCKALLRYELSKLSGSYKVISVGKVAQTVLNSMNIKNIRILHPAYYLYKHCPSEFIEELKKVVGGDKNVV